MHKLNNSIPSKSLSSRLISCALSGAILVLSPGLPAYQAMAQSIAVSPVSMSVPQFGVGIAPAAGPSIQAGIGIQVSNPSLSLGASLPSLSTLKPQTNFAPAATSVSQAAPSAAFPAVAKFAPAAAAASQVSPQSVSAAKSAPAAAAVSQASRRSVSPSVVQAVKSAPQSAPAATAVSRASSKSAFPAVAQAVSPAAKSLIAADSAKDASGRIFDGSAVRAEDAQAPVSAEPGAVSGRSGLAPSGVSGEESSLKTPAPLAAPAAPQLPSRGRLFLKALGASGLFLALDWGAKALFKLAGWPMVYHIMEAYRAPLMPVTIPLSIGLMAYYLWSAHAAEPMLKKLDELRKKHPIAGNALYVFLQILTFPTGIDNKRYAGDLAQKHPAVKTALAMLRLGLAAVVAGTIGNGLEGLFLGKVIDFIPFGKATANLADFYIFIGLPFVWMTLDFLKAARVAVESRTPAVMNWYKYYLPFVLTQVGFIYSTMAGYDAVPMLGWYLTIFSSLFLVGSTVATILLQPAVDRFNRAFRLSDSPSVRQEPVRSYLSAGYKMRRALAAGLASLLAALPMHKTLSAPRLGGADRQALVERYRQAKPGLVLMDWDKTFMDNWTRNNEPVTEERLELLRALKAAGIRVGFVTNRPLDGKGFGMASLLMERMDPELRKDFLLSTGGGSEVYKFGPQGETPDAPTLVTSRIEPAHMDFMSGFLRSEAVRLGIDTGKGGRDFAEERKGYELTYIVRNQKERIQELFDAFASALKAEGLDKLYDAKLKIPVKAGAAPYIRVRTLGADKAGGVRGILDVLKGEGKTIEQEEVLFFGDEFDPGNDDVRMAESLPAATAFAVGRTLDPRVKNTHLLPAVGADSTAGFLWDILGGKPPAP